MKEIKYLRVGDTVLWKGGWGQTQKKKQKLLKLKKPKMKIPSVEEALKKLNGKTLLLFLLIMTIGLIVIN